MAVVMWSVYILVKTIIFLYSTVNLGMYHAIMDVFQNVAESITKSSWEGCPQEEHTLCCE